MLAKQQAREAGAVEAWFVDELGLVTEGASSNAWIIDKTGALRTRDTQANILRGITRKTLLSDHGRARRAATSRGAALPARRGASRPRKPSSPGAGTLVLPVVSIDGAPVGDGEAGPVAKRLRDSISRRRGATAI